MNRSERISALSAAEAQVALYERQVVIQTMRRDEWARYVERLRLLIEMETT